MRMLTAQTQLVHTGVNVEPVMKETEHDVEVNPAVSTFIIECASTLGRPIVVTEV